MIPVQPIQTHQLVRADVFPLAILAGVQDISPLSAAYPAHASPVVVVVVLGAAARFLALERRTRSALAALPAAVDDSQQS